MLIGTPTMFTDILHHPLRKELDMSSLNLALVGGAPATPAMVSNLFLNLLFGVTTVTTLCYNLGHDGKRRIWLPGRCWVWND